MSLTMLMIMMVTVRFAACIKSSGDQCVNYHICIATGTCIKLNPCLLESSLGTSTDTTTDKSIDICNVTVRGTFFKIDCKP